MARDIALWLKVGLGLGLGLELELGFDMAGEVASRREERVGEAESAVLGAIEVAIQAVGPRVFRCCC